MDIKLIGKIAIVLILAVLLLMLIVRTQNNPVKMIFDKLGDLSGLVREQPDQPEISCPSGEVTVRLHEPKYDHPDKMFSDANSWVPNSIEVEGDKLLLEFSSSLKAGKSVADIMELYYSDSGSPSNPGDWKKTAYAVKLIKPVSGDYLKAEISLSGAKGMYVMASLTDEAAFLNDKKICRQQQRISFKAKK